jgi:N6-adenosine-specific RNA methylase IME4
VTSSPAQTASVLPTLHERWRVFDASLRTSLDLAIDLGRALVQAKASLPHGQFGRLFADHAEPVEGALPFTRNWAWKLMQLAENGAIGNVEHAQHLPRDIETVCHLASIPTADLEAAIADGRVTPHTTRDEAKALRRAITSGEGPTVVSQPPPLPPAGRFACIYADPPWQYGNQGTRAATDNHYPTMPLDDICALDVGGRSVADIAADDAHLHLWTTNAFLFDAKRVMEAWGFTYKSCFVWVKPQMGIGNYWRVSHEFLLFGVRGRCPFGARNKMSWAELPRGRHSAKPSEIRSMIEAVSPGPRIELFAREEVAGWSSWGNQVNTSQLVRG